MSCLLLKLNESTDPRRSSNLAVVVAPTAPEGYLWQAPRSCRHCPQRLMSVSISDHPWHFFFLPRRLHQPHLQGSAGRRLSGAEFVRLGVPGMPGMQGATPCFTLWKI